MTEELVVGKSRAVVDAEEAVLGACLLDPDALVKVRGLLTADMFSVWRNQVLFRAFCEIDEGHEPLDFVSVTWWLEKNGLTEEIQSHEVTDLLNSVPTALYAENYARLVVDAHRQRTLLATLNTGVQRLFAGEETVDQVQAWVTDRIVENSANGDKPEAVSDLVGGVVSGIKDTVQARREGVMVGVQFHLKDLDKIVGGLRGGDLTILAARPGMGKTTAALQTAYNLARDGGLVSFYSLEMGSEQLIMKFLSFMTGIPYDKIRGGDLDDAELVMLEGAESELSGLDILIKDDLFTIQEIKAHALKTAVKVGRPTMIVVDYIQLIEGGSGMSKNQEVSVISRTMKLLARFLRCPVMALSQLNRGVEQRGDKRPVLSDLRDSGTIEQDADQAIFLYRDGYYDPASEMPNILEFLVRKNRHGGTGTASTFFNLTCGRINDLERVRTELIY